MSVLKIKLTKNRILFCTYIIGIVVFFLYIGFPSDSIKTYQVYRLSKISPQIRVTIERVKPAFPPGIRLYNVDLYHRENVRVSIETIKIIPQLLSLFGTEKTFSFSGNAYAGMLNGNAEIVSKSPLAQMEVNTILTGIQVKDVQAIQNVSEYEISGILSGKFAYKSDARNQTLRGSFTLNDCRVEFAAPLLNQGHLTFKAVTADVVLNNQTLTIQRSSLVGTQMDASISGSITFDSRTGRQALNLNATITPHHVFWATLKKSLPFDIFKGSKSDAQGFPVKIRGTMDAPEFSFN